MTTYYYLFKERNWTGIPNIYVIDTYLKIGYYMNEIIEGDHYPSNARKKKYDDVYQALEQFFIWTGVIGEMDEDELTYVIGEAADMLENTNIFYFGLDGEYYFIYKHDARSIDNRLNIKTANKQSLKYDRLVPTMRK